MTVGALQKHKISTIADLERLSHEGLRYELLSGELKAMSPINMAHGDVTNCVAHYVMSFAIEHDLGRGFVGDLGVTISRDLDTVLAADWAFYLKERLPNPYSTGYTTVMPDIVLEMRSPGDSKREVIEKVQMWLEAGVKLVWTADPKAKTLTVYRPNTTPQTLNGNELLDSADILPGFSVVISKLFPSQS